MAENLHIDIVSPGGSVFKGHASGVIAPGSEGSFEVLNNHAPMIAAFGVGTLVVKTRAGADIDFATSGGFVEVLNNTVSILAETAEPIDGIDIERAKAAEARALERLAASGQDKTRAAAALERARNRLRAAMGAVGGKK
jgi:F-type H+-transporting ATPase subunit epsilon